jgi:hypothetical protein
MSRLVQSLLLLPSPFPKILAEFGEWFLLSFNIANGD